MHFVIGSCDIAIATNVIATVGDPRNGIVTHDKKSPITYENGNCECRSERTMSARSVRTDDLRVLHRMH